MWYLIFKDKQVTYHIHKQNFLTFSNHNRPLFAIDFPTAHMHSILAIMISYEHIVGACPQFVASIHPRKSPWRDIGGKCRSMTRPVSELHPPKMNNRMQNIVPEHNQNMTTYIKRGWIDIQFQANALAAELNHTLAREIATLKTHQTCARQWHNAGIRSTCAAYNKTTDRSGTIQKCSPFPGAASTSALFRIQSSYQPQKP